MGIMVDNIALGRVFLTVILFFLVSNIQTIRHTDIYLHVAVTGRKNERSLGTPSPPSKKMFFSEIGEHWVEKNCWLQAFNPCHG
jgi:hypothetical protein